MPPPPPTPTLFPYTTLFRSERRAGELLGIEPVGAALRRVAPHRQRAGQRSEEHTSELQSPCNLVCRLLLEKKKKTSFNCNLFFNHLSRYHTPYRCPHTYRGL